MKIFLMTGMLLGGLVLTRIELPKFSSGTQQPGFLADLRWQKRVILLFMPAPDHTEGTRQLQLFKQVSNDLKERDVVLIPVTGIKIQHSSSKTGDGQKLRKRYQVPENDFALVLIGKDGGEKFRTNKIVEPSEIFRIIDAMPMRQSELNNQKNKK